MIISCVSCGASFNIKPEAIGPSGRMVKCSKCGHRWRAMPEGVAGDEESADPPPERSAAPTVPETVSAAAASEHEHATLAQRLAESEGEPAAADAESPFPSLRIPDVLAAGEGPEEAAPKSRSGRKLRTAPPRPRSAARIISFFTLILLISGIASVAVFLQQKVMMWLPATQRLYALAGVEPDVLGKGLQIVEPKPKKEIDGNDEILVVEGEVRNIAAEAVDVPLMRGALLDKIGRELHIWTFTAAKPRIDPGETARYRTEFRNPPAEADRLDITFTRSDRRAESAQQVEAQGQ